MPELTHCSYTGVFYTHNQKIAEQDNLLIPFRCSQECLPNNPLGYKPGNTEQVVYCYSVLDFYKLLVHWNRLHPDTWHYEPLPEEKPANVTADTQEQENLSGMARSANTDLSAMWEHKKEEVNNLPGIKVHECLPADESDTDAFNRTYADLLPVAIELLRQYIDAGFSDRALLKLHHSTVALIAQYDNQKEPAK